MEARARISQTDALVDELKRFFHSENVQIGDKLPTEKKLCETYLVGRSTVREAIRTLQVMGYVEIKPGRGAFLAAKKLSQFDAALASWVTQHKPGAEEILRVRVALESIAVRYAVEAGTEADFQRIDRARIEFEEALFRRDLEALPALDEAFHRSIFEAGRSELLNTMNAIVENSNREWRARLFRNAEFGAKSVLPHQRIALAVLAKDSELAQLQARRHLEQIAMDMMDHQLQL